MKFPKFKLRESSALPWAACRRCSGGGVNAFDPNDDIYQSWAYETHDHDRRTRLADPEWEPLEAARYIRDVRTVTINPESVTGHFAAGGFLPADVEQINAEVGRFLDVVTQRDERLR